MHFYAAHRNAAVFPGPHDFRPARWLLPADSEEARLRHPYAFLPFLAGTRNCIGQKFAMQVGWALRLWAAGSLYASRRKHGEGNLSVCVGRVVLDYLIAVVMIALP